MYSTELFVLKYQLSNISLKVSVYWFSCKLNKLIIYKLN